MICRGLLYLFLILAFSNQVFTTLWPCEQPEFFKCLCGEDDYIGRSQYILNCTDLGFKEATMLQNISDKVQVLIFVGNNITKLPRNIFGTEKNHSQLRVIDMSRNNIKEILGQTFHRVSKVERLFLNHNDIIISSDEHHPRVFSNFLSLQELHLTNAFAENSPESLAVDLHDVFNTSVLTKLRKLHLEQNEIRNFKDPKIFCELISLMDLHLGDNKLQRLNLKLDCLYHIRYIDLEKNNFKNFKPEELEMLDFLTIKRNNLSINIDNNPFVCDEKMKQLYTWLQSTRVQVKNKNRLKCTRECNKEILLTDHSKVKSQLKAENKESNSSFNFILVLLLISTALLIYTNREPITNKTRSFISILSRKVHYTNINKTEAQEMDV